MNPGNQTTEILVPYAFERIDPPGSAVGLNSTLYGAGPAVAAKLTHEGTGGIVFPRYRLDGLAPSATVGHVIPEGGDGVTIYGLAAIKGCQVIEPDLTAGILVTYFRGGN